MNLREPNQYTAILERITAVLWKESDYFPFVPCTDYLGHLFWELIMAVAVARKSNRTLVLLKPAKNSGYRVLNEDVFECDFSCMTEKRKVHSKLMELLQTYEKVRTSLLQRMFSLIEWFWPIRSAKPVMRFHRCGIEDSNFVMAKIKGTQNYFDLGFLPDREASIRLTDSQREKARGLLATSGFEQNRWFAAAHVREAGYRGNEADHDARNFSQHALLPMIRRISSDGGFVVRMGTSDQQYIPQTKGLFDYAKSEIRSGLLDLYLIETSDYYVGSSSGLLSAAYAFGKPAFVINYVDFLTAGFRTSEMFIPKMPYDPLRHTLLSLYEYCTRAGSTWDTKCCWFVENRLEDIDDAFDDFLCYRENGFRLTGEDLEIYLEWGEVRRKTVKRIIDSPAKDPFGEMFKDVAVSTLSAPAVLAPSFLKKYLFQSNDLSPIMQATGEGQ